jgi:hypothetical protein
VLLAVTTVHSAGAAAQPIVEAFQGETYTQHQSGHFDVGVERKGEPMVVTLVPGAGASSALDFAGGCVEASSPVDVSTSRSVSIDLDSQSEVHVIEFKLEKAFFEDPEGHHNFYLSKVLPGRRTHHINLADANEVAPSLLRQLSKVCVAMTAKGFDGLPHRNTLRLYSVRFSTVPVLGGTTSAIIWIAGLTLAAAGLVAILIFAFRRVRRRPSALVWLLMGLVVLLFGTALTLYDRDHHIGLVIAAIGFLGTLISNLMKAQTSQAPSTAASASAPVAAAPAIAPDDGTSRGP